jgi:hypothetical protein
MLSVITDGLIYNKQIIQGGGVSSSPTILAFFTEFGIPKTGLTPTIKIRKLSDKSLIVTDAAMEEVGDGFYTYSFTSATDFEKYAFLCDGGSSLPIEERYVYDSYEVVVDQQDGNII